MPDVTKPVAAIFFGLNGAPFRLIAPIGGVLVLVRAGHFFPWRTLTVSGGGVVAVSQRFCHTRFPYRTVNLCSVKSFKLIIRTHHKIYITLKINPLENLTNK